MAKNGYMIEMQISAKDNDALNKSAVCASNLAGGDCVTLGAINNDGLFVATKEVAGTNGNVYMAYNPSEHFTVVGDNVYAGLSVDPRDYVNIANRPVDVFKPVKGNIIGLTDGNIKEGETPVKGSFLELDAAGYKVVASATADTFSLEVVDVRTLPFPQKGIGNEFSHLYVCRVAFN